MARYYAEGTIKKIVIEKKKVQFSLDPAERFYDELNDKERIRLIGEEEGSFWKYFTGEFSVSEPEMIEPLQQANREHLSICIHVNGEDIGEGSSMAEVKKLEVKYRNDPTEPSI